MYTLEKSVTSDASETNATGEVLPDIWFWDSPAISATSATNATSDTSDTNDTNTAHTWPEEGRHLSVVRTGGPLRLS